MCTNTHNLHEWSKGWTPCVWAQIVGFSRYCPVLEKGLDCLEEGWGGLALKLQPAPKRLPTQHAGASQPCPALPLEAESWIYTILAYSSYSGNPTSAPGVLNSWLLDALEQAVESKQSSIFTWGGCDVEKQCVTVIENTSLTQMFVQTQFTAGVIWPLWVSVTQKEVVCTSSHKDPSSSSNLHPKC